MQALRKAERGPARDPCRRRPGGMSNRRLWHRGHWALRSLQACILRVSSGFRLGFGPQFPDCRSVCPLSDVYQEAREQRAVAKASVKAHNRSLPTTAASMRHRLGFDERRVSLCASWPPASKRRRRASPRFAGDLPLPPPGPVLVGAIFAGRSALDQRQGSVDPYSRRLSPCSRGRRNGASHSYRGCRK